jgi:adenylate cyclase
MKAGTQGSEPMSDDRHESEVPTHGLDLEGLALEAETTPERIRRLVEIGAITPQADGTFDRGDVVRSRVVAAFEAEGFSLDQMATAIRERAIALDSVPLFYPDPSPRTGRTYGEFVEDLGPRGRLVAPALAAMGLSARSTDAPTHAVEEPLLKALIEGWSGVDEAYTLRAARIFGDAARRAAEGWVALFAEAISEPIEARYATIDEVVPRLLEPATHLAGLSPKLLAWLLERHLERSMNDLNISRIERRLEVRGLLPSRAVHPPAVAFVDVSEYTRLTIERGDELGALTAVRLGELAESVVRNRGGRVVKLLGDGVLLVFEWACVGVEAVVELMGAMLEAGLPPAHAGINVGPVVERDGDVFGTTVNVASRIAAYARPGVLVVSQPVVQACPELAAEVEPLGDVTLKSLDGPMSLFRLFVPRRSEG